jgi:hypothetical protein
MATYVKIIKESSPLEQEEWSFYFHTDSVNNVLYLDTYDVMVRESTRKRIWNKKSSATSYRRLSGDRWCQMKESDVPLTQEIKDIALEQFVKTLRVDVWSSR